jgi:hypothetical protein
MCNSYSGWGISVSKDVLLNTVWVHLLSEDLFKTDQPPTVSLSAYWTACTTVLCVCFYFGNFNIMWLSFNIKFPLETVLPFSQIWNLIPDSSFLLHLIVLSILFQFQNNALRNVMLCHPNRIPTPPKLILNIPIISWLSFHQFDMCYPAWSSKCRGHWIYVHQAKIYINKENILCIDFFYMKCFFKKTVFMQLNYWKGLISIM